MELQRHPPGKAKPRIIFIVGWGRSGSTLLGNAVGELQGCVHVGEVHDLWSAYAGRFECGCGKPLPDCEFWRQVGAAAPSVRAALDAGVEVNQTKRRHMRVRYVPRMLRGLTRGATTGSPLHAYANLADDLFGAVATAANAEVIVDSTKSPAAAALLLTMPFEASFIHLVRDPRATGFSWRRVKGHDPHGARPMMRHGYGYNASSWLYWNFFAELIRRRVDPRRWLRVRYEDFVASPGGVLRRIADTFALPTNRWPLQGRILRLGIHHTVEGNPSRFKTGPREIKMDDQWSTDMPLSARVLSVALTAPLFLAYGYHRSNQSP